MRYASNLKPGNLFSWARNQISWDRFDCIKETYSGVKRGLGAFREFYQASISFAQAMGHETASQEADRQRLLYIHRQGDTASFVQNA